MEQNNRLKLPGCRLLFNSGHFFKLKIKLYRMLFKENFIEKKINMSLNVLKINEYWLVACYSLKRNDNIN